MNDYAKFLAMYNKAKGLPEVEVTEEEFIAIMVATGETIEKSQQTAKLSKLLGSIVMVGDKMLKIKVGEE